MRAVEPVEVAFSCGTVKLATTRPVSPLLRVRFRSWVAGRVTVIFTLLLVVVSPRLKARTPSETLAFRAPNTCTA